VKALTLGAVLLLFSCALAHAQSTIFIVRHAEKAAPTSGDVKDPALSAIGRARAEMLAATLKDAQIAAIFVTEYKRTQQTAEPLVRRGNVNVVLVPTNDTPALITRLKEMRGNALVIGHSNTIPEILKSLGAIDPLTIGDEDYDNLFVLTTGSSPQLVRLHLRCGETTSAR
jgi:phosphohistidine phosphatase SixA